MSDYLISGETMTNLADSVRTLSGETGDMTPEEIINTVNNTKSAIDSLNDHINDKNNPHQVTAEQVGARPNTWMPTPADIGAATVAEVNQLKTSVSEGKFLVAAAVTDKGVSTAADATFATIASNIGSITTLSSGTSDATATATQILRGKTAYVKGSKVTGSMTDQGAVTKTFTPSTSSQSYTIPAGYHNGSGKVTVNAAPTSLIDGDATAANVLSGKTFFVDSYTKKTGSMPNNGAVAPAALNCGGSYTIPAGYHNGSGKVTANTLASQTSANATAAQILSGKTAWVNGTKITGTIASQAAQTITPGTSNKTIAAGKYLSGTQTIKGDANLKPENIKSGVSIFGVVGSSGVGGKSEVMIQTYYMSLTGEMNHQLRPGANITAPTGYSVSGIAEIRLTGNDAFYFSHASEDHIYLVLNNNNENWVLGGKLVPRGFTAPTITVSIEVDIIFTKVKDRSRCPYPYNGSIIYYYMPDGSTTSLFPANTPITIA